MGSLTAGDNVTVVGVKGTGACWYSGDVDHEGQTLRIERLAFGRSGGAVARCPDAAATAALPSGSRARIVAVHPEDAYASVFDAVVGRVVVLTTASRASGCWQQVEARTEGGVPMRLFRVALAPEGG